LSDTALTDDPLAALPLLAGLDAATRRALAERCRPRTLAAGELLFRAGEAGYEYACGKLIPPAATSSSAPRGA
jgi:hypothetical protein